MSRVSWNLGGDPLTDRVVARSGYGFEGLEGGSGFVLIWRQVAQRAVQAAAVDQSTQAMVANFMSLMVLTGPFTNGPGRMPSFLDSPMIDSIRALP